MTTARFKLKPSTRKLITRLKREIADAARANLAATRWLRTPDDQRPTPWPGPPSRKTEATLLCAARAHMHGRIHLRSYIPAGKIAKVAIATLPEQRSYLLAALEKWKSNSSLAPHLRAMIKAAILAADDEAERRWKWAARMAASKQKVA